MSDCNICVESYNKNKRAKIICYCGFEICRSCAKTYILNKIEEPHCMSCKVVWDRKFITTNFEKTFISKDYRNHCEEILVEREISMLPATQPYVERVIKLENMKKNIEEFTETFYIIRNEYPDLEKDKLEKNRNIHEILTTIKQLKNEYNDMNNSGIKSKDVFVRKCPNGDCHGFLSSSLKCELCEHFSCSKCREVKGKTTKEIQSHTCNPEIVESVKFLEKDSKPCPKCSSLTFKIFGCNQIWCVECHTPWDWSSGKIETGKIHNPHYIEYLAKNNNGQAPRDPNDIICGREINEIFLQQLFSVLNIDKTYMTMIISNFTHIINVEYPKYNRPIPIENNLLLRIDYIRNKIDKNQFKQKIQRKEKENNKKKEIANVLNTYINCMTDILYRLLDKPHKVNNILFELDELRLYCNESFVDISKTFNCKKYNIDEYCKFR
jgi:hypothetical protein